MSLRVFLGELVGAQIATKSSASLALLTHRPPKVLLGSVFLNYDFHASDYICVAEIV